MNDYITHLTQDQLSKYFISPELYDKTGTVEARIAVYGEKIITVIDGEIKLPTPPNPVTS